MSSQTLFIVENIWYFLASFSLNGDESKITFSAEQKSAIADGIIWGTLTIMRRTIERESPKKCATRDSKPFKQSKTALTDNTISINVLANDQELPARPRDFRAGLANEERNIGSSELTDVLSSIRRRHILKRRGNSFSYPRGRPISDSNPSNEKRGRKSCYDKSRANEILDQVLNDQQLFKKIDSAIISSDIYFKHRKYSIEVAFHQKRGNETSFFNTYKPVLGKYGLREIQPNNGYTRRENTSDDLIEKVATCLARDTASSLKEKRAIYTQGGLVYLDRLMQIHQQTIS